MDRVGADTEDSVADAMADQAAVDVGVEDEVHLCRRRKTTTYPRLVDRLPHYSAEEQHHRMPQILSNGTTIGIIVSCADLMWKMDIHLQHAHMVGENLGTRRDATDRMYSSTLRPDMPLAQGTTQESVAWCGVLTGRGRDTCSR